MIWHCEPESVFFGIGIAYANDEPCTTIVFQTKLRQMKTAKLIAILSLSLAPIAARGQIANIEIDHRVFENAKRKRTTAND